jgi:hypothetical protein
MKQTHSSSDPQAAEQPVPVLLLNVFTRTAYLHLEGLKFRNLCNGTEGEMTTEQIKKGLRLPVRLNQMVMKNPKLVDLIEQFGCEIANNE